MPNVIVVYANESRRPEYFAYFDYVLAAFARVGAVVVEEAVFLQRTSIGTDDKLVGFFINDHNVERVFAYARPENRWTYATDERATPDGAAYHGRIEFCHRLNVRRMVVTYQNERHLRCLREAGIGYVVMPCSVPRRRRRTEKSHAVFAAGAFDPAAYTTRFRVRKALWEADNWSNRVVHAYIEPVTGEAYYDVLDRYQLGIVCRADYRDRMVQKYVEFGMCHVLPIGDCPTYMPHDMRGAMVNVESVPDAAIVAEVKRLLANPTELTQRQEAYSSAVHRHYDLETNARRVIEMIRIDRGS